MHDPPPWWECDTDYGPPNDRRRVLHWHSGWQDQNLVGRVALARNFAQNVGSRIARSVPHCSGLRSRSNGDMLGRCKFRFSYPNIQLRAEQASFQNDERWRMVDTTR